MTIWAVEVVPSEGLGTVNCEVMLVPKVPTPAGADPTLTVGIANTLVTLGKSAAVEVAAVPDAIEKPAVLVAVVAGKSGRYVGALVDRVIWGMPRVEVTLGNSVPAVWPAVGTVQARSVLGSFVPDASEGGVMVGIS